MTKTDEERDRAVADYVQEIIGAKPGQEFLFTVILITDQMFMEDKNDWQEVSSKHAEKLIFALRDQSKVEIEEIQYWGISKTVWKLYNTVPSDDDEWSYIVYYAWLKENADE